MEPCATLVRPSPTTKSVWFPTMPPAPMARRRGASRQRHGRTPGSRARFTRVKPKMKSAERVVRRHTTRKAGASRTAILAKR